MSRPLKSVLRWTPRVLCTLFAAFMSLFALDVFGEGTGFWETILALLIHLISAWIILIVLALSWRWVWMGGVLMPLLGVLYIFGFGGRFPWFVYLGI